ncbi:unnamed protein product [Adineta ricciae]|nr:unnamed protein product [Adineta ricciae]
MNGIVDCPLKDDENLNMELFPNLKWKSYHCYFTNKAISRYALYNKYCDCGRLDDGFCEDENEIYNFTRRTIRFQTICDGFPDLYPILIDQMKETDETNCQEWKCNNIYTNCNGIHNCFSREDETDCDSSSLNCSSDSRLCVTKDTLQFICLPIKKMNDGIVDCLGGTDEENLCPMIGTYFISKGFYCIDKSYSTLCVRQPALCDGIESCVDGDDERFCQMNQSQSKYPICLNQSLLFLNKVAHFFCDYTEQYFRSPYTYFKLNGYNELFHKNVNENPSINVIYSNNKDQPLPLLDKTRCHRGLDLRVWLNKSSNNSTHTCLCPQTYYGSQCQYQNQRISLAIRFHTPVQLREIRFLVLVLLIDNTNQRTIHSYEQFTYLSKRDCKVKFNLYLLYSTRPKDLNRNYSIHIEIYDKPFLKYRTSFIYPIEFSFLPVYRLALLIKIPSENEQICSKRKCLHGQCRYYFNKKQTFCQCEQGWSGEFCSMPYNSTCSSLNSLSIGLLNHHRSICICKENYFGSQCYLRNRICDNFPCENNGLCVPYDDFLLLTNEEYFCICPKGFSGKRCELIDVQIDLIFDTKIDLSHSIFIHFITITPLSSSATSINKVSPERSTTLQTISQATNSIRIYWSQPFHLTFIETLDRKYYLAVIQPIYNHSVIINQRIDSTHRCSSINDLVNETFSQLHRLIRIKSYHQICQKYSPNLQCFYDDVHLCLCYDFQGKRLANCFHFDHQMKFDCFGQNHCENQGQCFQDSPSCPKRSICVCPSCYYGTRCQFTTSEFGLSLDAILAYHIIPDVGILNQTFLVKISFFFTILFLIIGFINGVLSLITFKNKNICEVGCGVYLFGSSITTILTTIFFGLKYFIYLYTQIPTLSNENFLKIQCYSLDFLLRICLSINQWLNACVALERTITIIQGIRFMKKKSKKVSKIIIIILLILIILTSIHEPISRHLLFEENDENDRIRIWCVVKYSSTIQLYNQILQTFHFFLPFLINLISSIVLIITKSYQQLHLHQTRRYKDIVHEQIQEHQHLLIAPIVLFLLALPRLIISYLTKCMNSTNDSWLFLVGYFISFIPSIITFFIFVLPSTFYKNEYRKSVLRYQKRVQQCFLSTLK